MSDALEAMKRPELIKWARSQSNDNAALRAELVSVRAERDEWRVRVDRDWQAQLTSDDLLTVEGRQLRAAAEGEVKSLRTKHIRALGDEVDRLTAELSALRDGIEALIGDHKRHMHRWIDDSCLIDSEELDALLASNPAKDQS